MKPTEGKHLAGVTQDFPKFKASNYPDGDYDQNDKSFESLIKHSPPQDSWNFYCLFPLSKKKDTSTYSNLLFFSLIYIQIHGKYFWKIVSMLGLPCTWLSWLQFTVIYWLMFKFPPCAEPGSFVSVSAKRTFEVEKGSGLVDHSLPYNYLDKFNSSLYFTFILLKEYKI